MRATVGSRTFESGSWLDLVSEVLAAHGRKAPSPERRDAAKQLSKGVSAVVGGLLIKPKGARE